MQQIDDFVQLILLHMGQFQIINVYLDRTLISINHLVEGTFIKLFCLKTHVHQDSSQFLIELNGSQ